MRAFFAISDHQASGHSRFSILAERWQRIVFGSGSCRSAKARSTGLGWSSCFSDDGEPTFQGSKVCKSPRTRLVVFSAGPGDRDQALLTELKSLSPDSHFLPKTTCLGEFLAILARAGMFIGSDSGPFHFAVGLDTPSIGLFGPMLPERVAPLEGNFRTLVGGECTCCVHARTCTSPTPCIHGVSVGRLWEEINRVYIID